MLFNLYSFEFLTSQNYFKSNRIIFSILKFATNKLKNQGQGKVFKADSVPLETRSTSSAFFFSINLTGTRLPELNLFMPYPLAIFNGLVDQNTSENSYFASRRWYIENPVKQLR